MVGLGETHRPPSIVCCHLRTHPWCSWGQWVTAEPMGWLRGVGVAVTGDAVQPGDTKGPVQAAHRREKQLMGWGLVVVPCWALQPSPMKLLRD